MWNSNESNPVGEVHPRLFCSQLRSMTGVNANYSFDDIVKTESLEPCQSSSSRYQTDSLINIQ